MPNCSSSSSAIRQHLPGDRTVQSCRFRLSLYATPTSRSSLRRRRLYLTLSSMNFPVTFNRRTSFPYVLSLSLTPPCPNTAQQSPRNADATRHRHRVRHRVRHAGDRATPLRPSTMATRPYTNDAASSPRYTTRPHTNAAASPRRVKVIARQTRRHHSTSTLHLLSADKIC